MDPLGPLSAEQASRILAWLDVPPVAATREWLDALLGAYVQRVPWESASRIARRASSSGAPAACVAWPPMFWDAAMTQGCGGTCFESNAALAALLAAVGLPSTLTINDMPPTMTCHTALVVGAGGRRLVVDVGFPLYAAVPLPLAEETSEVHTRWGSFSASPSPAGPGRFQIGQHPHPRPLAFELIDRAVSPSAYAAATCDDYGPCGLFLDAVVLKKVVAGDPWRFSSKDRPWVLERFRDGVRETRPLPEDAGAAALLARHFGIDEAIVGRALAVVGG